MGFGQVDAACPNRLPCVADGVKPNYLSTLRNIKQKDLYNLEQCLWVAVIEIDLIGAERRPNVDDLPIFFGKWSQQWCRSWSCYAAQVSLRRLGNEHIFIFRIIRQKSLKPATFGGHMINHCIEHQAKISA